MNYHAIYLVLLMFIDILDHLGHVTGSQVHHIRGIPISRTALYAPDRDFECFDGSLLIPFDRVNDDYCDCADGSDEPGTAACTNGSFYCQNTGHKPVYIPSTWVNDGVCDCCDASDEYASGKNCVDNCHELGKEARLKAQKAAELIKEGSKIRLEMIAKGKQMRSELQAKLVKLRTDQEEAELIKKEKEVLKVQAEEREKIALEKYKPVETEQAAQETTDEEEELRESEAEDYFKLLDSDSNGIVTIAELQTRSIFDKDHDTVVTEEEAMYFLNHQKEVELEDFIERVWPNIKPFLMLEQGMFKPAAKEEEETEAPEVPDEHDEELPEGEEVPTDDQEPETETSQVQYDEETEALINEANSARETYEEAEKAASELHSEFTSTAGKLERDYGQEDEFLPLHGQCFEYTDLEYVYTLCLYGRANQRSKSGGSDVVLGHFKEWIGPEGNKYSKAKYADGLTCWNGPSRSTIVNLICGKENKLISVTEPSRCEYAMEFSTPAVCYPSAETVDTHDEL